MLDGYVASIDGVKPRKHIDGHDAAPAIKRSRGITGPVSRDRPG
jgi:hypothetical protein